eukprot:jgi/Botrbrau1/23344/Bobra.0051s0004.1
MRTELGSQSDFLRNEDLPAMFWDSLPENGIEHPDMAAIQALLDESSPEELAENFRVQGNEQLTNALKLAKNRKFYIRKAVETYSKGIAVSSADKGVVSILHSNRAQAQLKLENYRAALHDCLKAISADRGNIKAYFRGAQAAFKLQNLEGAIKLCNDGLEVEAEAPELLKLKETCEAQLAEKSALEREQNLRKIAERAPALKLADAMLSAGWRVGLPQFSIGSEKPFLDKEGNLHTPVLFIYPESRQTDAVQDFDARHPFAAHFDVMFGADAPALGWDQDGTYTRDRIRCFYLTHAASPLSKPALVEVLAGGWPSDMSHKEPSRYGPKSARLKGVDESCSLADVLRQEDYVMPGIPVFFLLAEGTPFMQRFLEDN